MVKRLLSFALLLTAPWFFSLPALADSPSIGITLNVANGVHEEPTGIAKVPVVPAPVIDLRVPFERFELRAETLPPLGPIGYGTSSTILRSTRIDYAAAMGYYAVSPLTRVGAGMSLFNQQSEYAGTSRFASVSEVDSSRVGGLRIGIEQTLLRAGSTSFVTTVEASPAMHALLHADATVVSGGTFHESQSGPETAALVDAQLRAERRLHRLTWTYGVRYINYTAKDDDTGALTDRNRLLMVFSGIRWALGH